MESALELAKFVERTESFISPPEGIIVTAGVLTNEARSFIEHELNTKVFNQYGSREVGPIACECSKQEGLHTFDFFQFIEIDKPDSQGYGNVVITNLRNFSMPLIRYDIGDTAKISGIPCSCGRQFHLIESISGRVINHFILANGTKIHGQYFIHLFYFNRWIKRFQVIQKSYDEILCKIVVEKVMEADLDDITAKIQLVMGSDCMVTFDFVDNITPTKSGKHLYTISEIAEK